MKHVISAMLLILCCHMLQSQDGPCRPPAFKARGEVFDTIVRPIQYDALRSVRLFYSLWNECDFTILYDSTNQFYLYTIENRSKSQWLLVGTQVVINQFEERVGIALGYCCQTMYGCYQLSLMSETLRRQIAPQTTFAGRVRFTRDKFIGGQEAHSTCLLISKVDTKPFPDKHNFCYDAVEDYPDIKKREQVMTVRMTAAIDFGDYLPK